MCESLQCAIASADVLGRQRGDHRGLDQMLKLCLNRCGRRYDGRTAATTAAEGQAEMTAHLLQRGADITHLIDGEIPRFESNGAINMIQLLSN